jgi:hypothetical protein
MGLVNELNRVIKERRNIKLRLLRKSYCVFVCEFTDIDKIESGAV